MKVTDLTVGQLLLLRMILNRPRGYEELKQAYCERTGNENTGGDLNELERLKLVVKRDRYYVTTQGRDVVESTERMLDGI